MKTIWKVSKEVEIKALDDNLFLFKFQGDGDKNKVMESTPWSFDKQMLLLHPFNGDLRPHEYVFGKVPLWVRIYDLPLGMRNRNIGQKIRERVGTLLAIDDSIEEGGWA
ncbi:hypothetical protein PTKIN_Ptkin06aG0124900 [Pterospermum kingtungense]